MRIVWAKRAVRDLRAAYEYWMKEKSEDAADLMVERIFSTVELLEQNPELGRSGRVPSTQELILKPLPFLLAYRARHNKIEILALLHGARKWPMSFR
jgi:plasmid stabilization system protein ParE